MADLNITVKVSTLISDEQFVGDLCKICNDPIYGIGFRLVLTTNVNQDVIPSFRETNIVLCASCKDAVEW